MMTTQAPTAPPQRATPGSKKNSILVVEDDAVLNRLLQKELGKIGYEVQGAGTWAEARTRVGEWAPDLVLLDLNLPDSRDFGPLTELASARPVVMLTAYASIHQAVEAMRLGAADYLVKPVNLDELELVIRTALERSQMSARQRLLEPNATRGPAGMVGESLAMRNLRQIIHDVAPSDVTVLIHGESGTGKELVAQALHVQSPRHQSSLVPVDCCTLQESLFESELFGYERGAFTGADRRKPGLIEAAVRGTLFLDEIGESGPAIQAKLLRVLETGRFRRVGATLDQRADVRVIAATNRDLHEHVRLGQFRADLYYRLSSFVISVPPLRERREDIPLLIQHFARERRQMQGRQAVRVSPSALDRMLAYDWPGNVRELRNVVERALILAGAGETIELQHLPTLPARAAMQSQGGTDSGTPGDEHRFTIRGEPTLDRIEREYLETLLGRYEGNRRKVAEVLGISERTAYRMMAKYSLK